MEFFSISQLLWKLGSKCKVSHDRLEISQRALLNKDPKVVA